MTTSHIQKAVDRGLQIRSQITALETELKAIETTLETAALEGDQIPLEDQDREGRQFLATGSEMIVPVILESDLIQASFQEGGETHAAILNSLGLHDDKFPRLWRNVSKFERLGKDGQSYRKSLRELLPPDTSAAVLNASIARDKNGIPKSRIVIAWERSKLPA